MTLKVEKGKLLINNFLGEKKPRTAIIKPNVNVEVKGQEVFVSSHDKDLAGQYYQCAPWRQIPQDELLIEENLIDNLIELYKPKSYSYESPKTFDITTIAQSKMFQHSSDMIKSSSNNTLSCLYSKYQVSKILENFVTTTNEKYDFIISIRFDFLNKLNIQIEDFVEDKISEPKTDSEEESATGTSEASSLGGGGEEEKTLSDTEIEETHKHKMNNRGAHHHRVHGHLRGKNFLLENGVKLYSHGEIESAGYDEYDSNGVNNLYIYM
jgi:hypothetical protein